MKKITLVIIAVVIALMSFPVTAGARSTAQNIDYVDALYFEEPPTIDGYISEDEWGSVDVYVEAADAETKDGSSPYTRFLYWRCGTVDDYTAWEYELWFRWDENYYYMGAKVKDPDYHSLKKGTTETWNGDSLQTRVDKVGANAVVQGDEFMVTGGLTKPWSGDKTVPDFLFGYVEIAGGFTEAWENTTNKGMTAFSANPMGVAKAVVAPAGFEGYSEDCDNGITTYETAIPWAYILNGEFESLTYTDYKAGRPPRGNPQGAIGRELGVSVTVLDDGNHVDPKWDAFLAWGSGICHAQWEEGAKTCTGSNSVTLSKEAVQVKKGYKTLDPTRLLDAKFSTANHADPGVFYDLLAGDYYCETKTTYENLSVLTYDDPNDISIWGARQTGGNRGVITDMGGEHGNVLVYGADDPLPQNTLETIEGEDKGGIFYKYPTSFTFEFDFQYTGTEIFEANYDRAIYNWFGGADGRAFRCGYFFNDSAFEIVDNNGGDSSSPTILKFQKYDLKKENWYKWRFQYDNESCTMRFWIDDLTTDADNQNSRWGELIFNTCWRYFYYSDEAMKEEGAVLTFRRMNVQCMFDNVKIYNFASIDKVDQAVEEKPVDGTVGGTLINGGNGAQLLPGGAQTGDNLPVIIIISAISAIATAVLIIIIIKKRK